VVVGDETLGDADPLLAQLLAAALRLPTIACTLCPTTMSNWISSGHGPMAPMPLCLLHTPSLRALRPSIIPSTSADASTTPVPETVTDMSQKDSSTPSKRKSKYIPWHELLRRTFNVDVTCAHCKGQLRLIALIPCRHGPAHCAAYCSVCACTAHLLWRRLV